MQAYSTGDMLDIVEDFNRTEDQTTLDHCTHQLFEQTVSKHIDKVAVVCGDLKWTYGQLNQAANRVARSVIEHGIKNGDVVAVALDRSVLLVAVLLGMMKSGATYVPIDPDLPVERMKQMIEDSSPSLLISSANDSKFSTICNISRLNFQEKELTTNLVTEQDNLNAPVDFNRLAYIMYTSGSTGIPKGVEIRHQSIANLLLSMQKEPGCSSSDSLLAVTTISFDMAVPELFLPLISGATTVIAQKQEVRDTAALTRLIELYDITVMQATPAFWQMHIDCGWEGKLRLQKILCGGEALSKKLANRLLACSDLAWNMYGPTEATVYASIWKMCKGQDISIGHPITNVHAYVLDEQLSPVSLGEQGELYIGGASVAQGYHKREVIISAKI